MVLIDSETGRSYRDSLEVEIEAWRQEHNINDNHARHRTIAEGILADADDMRAQRNRPTVAQTTNQAPMWPEGGLVNMIDYAEANGGKAPEIKVKRRGKRKKITVVNNGQEAQGPALVRQGTDQPLHSILDRENSTVKTQKTGKNLRYSAFEVARAQAELTGMNQKSVFRRVA